MIIPCLFFTFQEPDIVIDDISSVIVDYSVGVLDVLFFSLVNEGPCTNFICSAKCNNERKNFWIESGNMTEKDVWL